MEKLVMMSCLVWVQSLPSSPDALPATHSAFLEYLEVLFVLAGVLIFAYVLLRLGLPRMLGMTGPTDGPIRVVARQGLEPRKTLYLVNVGSQLFLLGTAESQVQCLTAIDPENASTILSEAKPEPARAKEFRQVMSWFQKAGKADC
jgi:flagellar biogenesis protein FliO